MTTAQTATQDKFAELFAKIIGETHHKHHEIRHDIELDIVSRIKQQDAIDQFTIDHGYHNGTAKTHHGVSGEYKVIAEYNNNEIRLAAKEGRAPILMEKSDAVNGPHDMIRVKGTMADGTPIIEVYQAKYCKDVVRSLDSCIEHMGKYPNDYAQGANGTYVIPKDQHDLAVAILKGEVPEGISEKYAEVIKGRLEKVQEVSGVPFEEKVTPGVTYEEAQRDNNADVHKKRQEKIEEEHNAEKREIEKEFSPNLKNSMRVGLEAAGVAGCLSVVFHIGNNLLKGKNIFVGDYDKDDCFELVKTAGAAAGIAGVTATVVHYLETVARHTGTIVLTTAQITKAVTPLVCDYYNGKISFDEMKIGIYSVVGAVVINAVVGVAVGVAAGAIIAAILPAAVAATLPAFLLSVAGAVVGIGIGALLDYSYKYVSSVVNADVAEQTAKHNAFIEELQEAYYRSYEAIEKKFAEAFNLAERSLDKTLPINDRLKALDDLSEHYGGERVDTEFSREKTMAFLFG